MRNILERDKVVTRRLIYISSPNNRTVFQIKKSKKYKEINYIIGLFETFFYIQNLFCFESLFYRNCAFSLIFYEFFTTNDGIWINSLLADIFRHFYRLYGLKNPFGNSKTFLRQYDCTNNVQSNMTFAPWLKTVHRIKFLNLTINKTRVEMIFSIIHPNFAFYSLKFNVQHDDVFWFTTNTRFVNKSSKR